MTRRPKTSTMAASTMAASTMAASTMVRGLGSILLAGQIVIAAASAVGAQDYPASHYPARPVKIIVPAAPGGALDTISRLLAHKVAELWNQQFYIENKPGANWIIGMDAAAKSAPDGYTLLFIASSGLTVIPFVFPNMPVDPLKDLAPVTVATTTPFVLLANPNIPAKSIAELVDYIRANPGKLNHASNSATTILVSELFKNQAKIDYVDINFRGASEAIAATQAGTTQFCFVDLGSATSAIEGKTLRPLALTMPQRYALAPDIPTFAEAGLPGVAVSSMTLVLAPANVPGDIMTKLNGKFREALQSPEVVDRLRAMDQVVAAGAVEGTTKALLQEAQQWKELIKERNIHFGN
jgi:tripartite-type tricarboxylate transporter receptor subunit TctC